ncbi:MAG: lasso RiPP family leader peptide-containing protein [Actinomycetota bacterium]|nr:lasso RiPP family leader peptide-containing protein [Actinomycetota bacterium]
MADDEAHSYEPPTLLELGTVEDVTHGPPLFSGSDALLF